MTWHEDIGLEVRVEFRRLSDLHWDRTEDCLQVRWHESQAGWAEHGQWWRKTAKGRRHAAAYAKKRAARLKRVVVAVRGCTGCGKPFEVTAFTRERKRGRVCSLECRGRSRKNIETVTMRGASRPLARWCEESGVALKTAFARIKRGWDAERAVFTPVGPHGGAHP